METTGLRDTDTGFDEAALVDRARAGDREAQEMLVRRHLGDVFDLAYRILGDRDLAQDATQDAMVNALRGLGRFRGEASFRTWLMRITMNAAKSQSRRRWRRHEVQLLAAGEVESEEPTAERRVAVRDEADRVSEMLERLPHKQRMAVILRTQRGLSYQEVGALLECSEGAARVNYHLGIKRLREMLQ